jgi:hypothetical protein
MAEGRSYVQLAFWIIFFPGLFVAMAVLSINLVGDGLRDTLDPRLGRRMLPGDTRLSEGEEAAAFVDEAILEFQVGCRADAGELDEEVT